MARGAGGYFGIYRGVVLNNADPENTGRLILQIPTVLGNRQSYWASPSAPPGVALKIPRPGDHVWVMFEGGSTDAPVWTGVLLAEHLAPAPTNVVTTDTVQTITAAKTFGVAPVVPDGSWGITTTAGLQAALDSKLDGGGGVLSGPLHVDHPMDVTGTAGVPALRVGPGSAYFGHPNGTAYVSNNLYYDGTTWRNIFASNVPDASRLQVGGALQWEVSTSGAATTVGAAQTMSQRFAVSSLGGANIDGTSAALILGANTRPTNDSERLIVYASSTQTQAIVQARTSAGAQVFGSFLDRFAFNTNVGMNDLQIRFRGYTDPNHYIGFTSDINGPTIQGYLGAIIREALGGTRIAQFKNDGITFDKMVYVPGNNYTYYGPNSSWGAYLRVGGNGFDAGIKAATVAQIAASDGNLHMDAGTGKDMWLNWGSGAAIRFGTGGGGGSGSYVDSSGAVYDTGVRVMLRGRSPLTTNSLDNNVYYQDGGSLNSYWATGHYNCVNIPTGNPWGDNRWFWLEVFSHISGAHWQKQIIHDMTGGSTQYFRKCNGGDPTVSTSWTGWSAF